MTDALLHISFIVQAFSILFSPDNNRLAIYKKPYCNIKIIISSLQNDPTYFFKGINRHSMFFFAFHLFFFYLWLLFKNRAWPWRHLDFKLNYANFFFFFVSGLDNPDKHASDLTLSKTIILDNHCSSFRTEEGMTYTLLRNAA